VFQQLEDGVDPKETRLQPISCDSAKFVGEVGGRSGSVTFGDVRKCDKGD
jgi:hypothetical protein